MLTGQEGFQTKVLSTSADIAIVGSGAGCGKTFTLALESCRHLDNPNMRVTFFRRTTTQIRAAGGLWDTSKGIYPLIGGVPKQSYLEWHFPSGALIKFAHLEYDKNADEYQGSQIPLIIFDELTSFTAYQFWFLYSRNRTDIGVRPYIRASCNPDPNSWVAKLVEWWIDQNTGFPIPERAGVIRYMTRVGERIVWGDTRQQVVDQCPELLKDRAVVEGLTTVDQLIRSFTFIPGSIYENKLFIAKDPGYLGTLHSLTPEEKLRLLDGNWKVSLDGLMLCHWERIEQIYDNYPEKQEGAERYITVDAARFGKDFATIKVWKGWECIYLVVYKISDAHDLNGAIEHLRQKFYVTRDNCIIDADGVGDGTVKLGSYTAFHGGSPPIFEPDSKEKFKYHNLKTQCMYRFAQKRVNPGQVRYSWNSETVQIFDGTYKNGIFSTKIMIGSEVKDVRDLQKEELRSWKRRETADMGPDTKYVIKKEDQKAMLGRSPDFSDNDLLREFAELMPRRRGATRIN